MMVPEYLIEIIELFGVFTRVGARVTITGFSYGFFIEA